MHSCCIDAADDKSVQPIKILLVAALLVPLLIEIIDCLPSPAHLIGARGEHVECPKSTDQLTSFVGKSSQLRQSTLFRMTVVCTPEKLRL